MRNRPVFGIVIKQGDNEAGRRDPAPGSASIGITRKGNGGADRCLLKPRGFGQRTRALLVPGTGAQGYAKLLELLAACAGMPNERELKKEVRDAERNPEVRGEIARYKLELEAEALFDEGVALFDAGDERRAERTIARLLKTPKYADTPAARKAAERFPQWVPEKES